MNCKDILLEKFGKEFSSKDIDDILNHAKAIIKKNKGVDDFGKLIDYVIKEKVSYLERKQVYLKQIEKKVYNDGLVDMHLNQFGVTESNAKKLLESFLSRDGKFQTVSLESTHLAKYNEYMNMIGTLDKLPEFALLRDGSASDELQSQVVKGIWKLSNKFELDKNISPNVRTIVETLHAVNKKRLNDLQSIGFNIKELDGYVYSGAYDPNIAREMGVQKFAEKVFKHIDTEATARKWGIDLESDDGLEEFNNLITDIFETISTKDTTAIYKNSVEDIFAEVKNPNKFNHSIARSRSFVFSNADDFHTFFTDMSGKNLLGAIHRDIRKTAKTYATSSIFGLSPSIGREFVWKKVNESLIQKGLKPLSMDYKKRLDTLFNIVSGNDSIGNNIFTITAKNTKRAIDMALLGKAMWKAIYSDPVYSAAVQSTISYDNFFYAYTKSMGNFISNVVNPTHRKDLSKRFQLLVDSIHMETMDDRMGGYGGFSKGMVSAHNFYMKYTGLNWQSVNMKTANATMASMHLYDVFTGRSNATKEKDLGVLRRFGFSDTELKILEHGIDSKNKFLDPETLRSSDINTLRKTLTGKKRVSSIDESGKVATKEIDFSDDEILQQVESTATKLAAYFNDIALLGSPNPTKATQLLMSGMVDPSTPVGALMSLITMYKGFSASIYRVYQNIAWHDGVDDKNALVQYMFAGRGALAYTMVSSLAAGGAALMTIDLLDGKTSRDPTRPEFLVEAFMAGGAGGLLADYALENYEQGKKDIVKDMAGPAIGRLLPDIFEVKAGLQKSLIEGDADAMQSTFINLSRWIPAQNLWLTNAFFGNMILDKYRSWADPRYERRREKAMQEMSGDLWNQRRLIED